ncbi:MAG: TorF family putative porin [Candidatus Omnitrophota bacterium]|jgi:hypothetical protein
MKLRTLLVLCTSFTFLFGAFSLPGLFADEGEPSTISDLLKAKGIDVEINGTMDFWDKYVWRGQYLDRDNVLQPGFSLSTKGFTVGYWGSFDMENQDALASDESDYYISYTYDIAPFSFTAGHTWYDFPEGNTSSKEFSFAVAMDTFLAPVFTFYHDYEDGKDLNTDKDGNYFSLGLSHSLALNKAYGITLDLGATIGYVDGQWLSGEGTHITPTVGISIPITKSLTVTPTIGYNVPFGDLHKSSIGNQDAKFFGGIKTAVTF